MKFVITTLKQALIDYPSVRYLNLVSGGDTDGSEMEDVINYSTRHSRITVIIALQDAHPIGWVWLFHAKGYYDQQPKRFLTCWIYVPKLRRRKGVGSQLYRQAKKVSQKRHRPIRVDPWDERSFLFYEHVNGIPRW